MQGDDHGQAGASLQLVDELPAPEDDVARVAPVQIDPLTVPAATAMPEPAPAPEPPSKPKLGLPDLPDATKFGIVFKTKGLIFGIVLDLAIEILLQQFGIAPFEPIAVARAIGAGVMVGIAAPTLGRTIGAITSRIMIRNARAEAAGATGAAE